MREHHNLEVISHQLDCRHLQFWFISAIFLCLNSQTNLSIRRSRRTKWARGPLSFPALKDGEGCQKAGALPSGACLMEGGATWLPFYMATLCLIHPNQSYYGHTLVPLILKLQLLISQRCAAAQLHLALFCSTVNSFRLKSFRFIFTDFVVNSWGCRNWVAYGHIWRRSGKNLTRSHFL